MRVLFTDECMDAIRADKKDVHRSFEFPSKDDFKELITMWSTYATRFRRMTNGKLKLPEGISNVPSLALYGELEGTKESVVWTLANNQTQE